MTLCRSDSFDSLLSNSECSQGLRLIPSSSNASTGGQENCSVDTGRQAHNLFYLNKTVKHTRASPHPWSQTDLWAGRSTAVRNPPPTSTLQMLLQPQICVPIRLWRVELMEPHCFKFIHHTFLFLFLPFLTWNPFHLTEPLWTSAEV